MDHNLALRINVVSGGRFTAFDLARELEATGYLAGLYTTYPKLRVRQHYTGKHLHTFSWLIWPYWLASRMHFSRIESKLNWQMTEAFDRWAARTMTECTVLHALSSWCLYSGTAAKQRFGAWVVYDRGSACLPYEENLLQEEALRIGTSHRPTDPRFLEKDAAELELADTILVPSQFARRTFIEHGIAAQRIHIVPLTSDLRLFQPATKRDRIFRIIYAGRIGHQKGIVYLLRAVKLLQRPDVEVIIFGDVTSDFGRALHEFSDLANIRWRGPVPQAMLAGEMTQGSVFVLPSLSDGFGMVVAQAMACGVPVITSENTGASDLVNNGYNGYVVPIRDAQAIYQRLLYLYENEAERAEMGHRAYDTLRMHGDWGTYAKSVVQVYDDSLQQRAFQA